MNRTDYLNSILKKLPDSPGVYLMKDIFDNIIYIGKAISLKKRIRSYFSTNIQDLKVLNMVSNISDIEYIVMNNEVEALLLENNLIKKNQPFYNILLRDDKSFPYIKVTKEDFPKVLKTRNKLGEDGLFFGPYTDVIHLNNYLRDINDFFKIRDCNRNIYKSIENRERPCLNYHIGICTAPCAAKISKEDYNRDVSDAIEFLKGDHSKVKAIYKEKMEAASSELRFEEAAIYRDRLKFLDSMRESQNVATKQFKNRQDYISYAIKGSTLMFTILRYESGNLVERENIDLELKLNDMTQVLPSFILQYYLDRIDIPKEIYIDSEEINLEVLSEVLSKEAGEKISLSFPKIGSKKDILKLAQKNSLEELRMKDLRQSRINNYLSDAIKELQLLTGIDSIKTIESYDISNISGRDSVGVKVVYKNGKKSPSDYRRYKINQSGKPDDYASLSEVIERRLSRGDFPDIILLDGGRGHVSTIEKLLLKNNVKIPVFGIYKNDKHQTRGLADAKQNYEIDSRTSLFRFLSEIQNEVHRYAIAYHRKTRESTMLKSDLDNIKGIGAKRKLALLRHFGDIEGVKKATLEELTAVDGMNKLSAKAIIDYYKEKNNG